MKNPRIMQLPDSQRALGRGVDHMTNLLAPTLGPITGVVAIHGPTGQSPPELLGNAALIARRTTGLEDPFESMGAMTVRQVAWTVYEMVGDGAATAVVLMRAIVRAAQRSMAAGANATDIRAGLDLAVQAAVAQLPARVRPCRLPAELARMVSGTLPESTLAQMVGDLVEFAGADGSIRIEDGNASTTDHDYVQGARWETGSLSFVLIPEGQREVVLQEPRIYVSDAPVTGAQLEPVLERSTRGGIRNLLVIAPSLDDAAIALLYQGRSQGVFDGMMAVRAPGVGNERAELLADIAVMTGGIVVQPDLGLGPMTIVPHALGSARQAWATRKTFGLLGGRGAPGAVRRRIHELRDSLPVAARDDQARRARTARLANLVGTSAIVRVGAPTAAARKELRRRIEASVATASAALAHGVVPGAGAALVACEPSLQKLREEVDPHLQAGVSILLEALSEPARVIAMNAGLAPGPIIERMRRSSNDLVYDVVRREWTEATPSGIEDPVDVVVAALETSVSAASMILTTDVLVRGKRPDYATRP
ncbi:MAG TPA: TCP-1/cpn60 chaperonin family protein [Thermomicrobiales bacterium]|nr:TCP-1/cpn60 chaperonin family protein [Thermomicrobiales bacterium]